ncbi:hypothetical protein [uncultured Bacteroides sp.]|uniref:hypothetical protein n=1 Tax=uncultured Bacteroides sp. TaxID=162156 RepID=UPI0026E55479|nr:hypothetical protein [uncultured Bacteroides sp.]
MKKDMIFFSTEGKGLTSTSANHIANLAKEMVRETEASLEGLTFYSTSVALIGNDSVNTLREGDTSETLGKIKAQLHTIAKANSLIAWLREAIKAKERLLKEVDDLTLNDFMKLQGIKKPDMPTRGTALTEDEYYASLSVDERNRFYSLEALASVLGKAVHPAGVIANAREQLNERLKNPKTIEGKGRDALLFFYTPTVKTSQVDEVYFAVQKEFREVQASLNAIKYDCLKAVKESEIEVQTKYADDYAKYQAEITRIQNEMSTYEKKRTREIGSFKIRIPDSLVDIYERVAHLGKN